MNPEYYEHVMEKLLGAGAVDVYFKAIQMKKNRPAVQLNVLINQSKSIGEDILADVLEIIFRETSSLGVRIIEGVKRLSLDREIKQVDTPWGVVNMKAAYLGEDVVNIAPEYEDCKRIAQEHNLPLKFIYREVKKLLNSKDIKSQRD